jgi:aminopeptidase N
MYDAGYLLHEQNDMAGTVGRDLETSFAFFNQAFGPTPVKAFTATEILSDHGEAYPGLVLLSLLTFQTTSEEGYSEMFRAHEVAHQWWGIGVRPATYHDRWLAEGFSEFSGLWYMARVRGSIDLYEKRLKESREALLKRRDEAAPIWLGTRAGTSKHPEDYALVVYKKGAWVLHMLRDLLIDWDGGNEDVFDTLMRDFYATHLGEAVTTEQFLTHVETHVGQSMQWFFDQWVYGSAIPTYVFSHRLEEQADGQWKAFVRVRQERVPDDFQMVVPVLLDFGEAGTAVVKLLVSGPLTEAELPLLPMKPERVEFNPFEAVLAETKTEGWKGG